MKINLIPQRRDDALELSLAGDVLSINGDALDLSAIPAGATLPRDAVDCEWLASDIERDADGEITLSLILPHEYTMLYVKTPDQIVVSEDGPIHLPSLHDLTAELL